MSDLQILYKGEPVDLDAALQQRAAPPEPPGPPPPSAPPTRRQMDALRAIIKAIDETGVAPSCEELMAALDLKGRGQVHSLLSHLDERGWIRRIKNRPRAITVLHRPAELAKDWLVLQCQAAAWIADKATGAILTRHLPDAQRFTRDDALDFTVKQARPAPWDGHGEPLFLPVHAAGAEAAAELGRAALERLNQLKEGAA